MKNRLNIKMLLANDGKRVRQGVKKMIHLIKRCGLTGRDGIDSKSICVAEAMIQPSRRIGLREYRSIQRVFLGHPVSRGAAGR